MYIKFNSTKITRQEVEQNFKKMNQGQYLLLEINKEGDEKGKRSRVLCKSVNEFYDYVKIINNNNQDNGIDIFIYDINKIEKSYLSTASIYCDNINLLNHVFYITLRHKSLFNMHNHRQNIKILKEMNELYVFCYKNEYGQLAITVDKEKVLNLFNKGIYCVFLHTYISKK